MVNHVIILGKAQGWEYAPFFYEDDTAQTWGMNDHILSRPFDMLFEIHDIYEMLLSDPRGQRFLDRVNEMEIPILCQEHYDFIPTSEPYPVEEICNHFGIDYFTSSIDYMLAYGIWKGIKKIDIYGVHVAGDTEWSHQKASLEFWIGVAIGRGIDIKIHGSPTILKTIYLGHETVPDRDTKDGLCYGYLTEPRENRVTA